MSQAAFLSSSVSYFGPASLKASDDDFRAILTWKYLDWIDWLSDRCVAHGVTKFFQVVVYNQLHRIQCQMGKAAFGAGNREILISLDFTPQQRKVLAALRARDEKATRLHLIAMGFLRGTPHP